MADPQGRAPDERSTGGGLEGGTTSDDKGETRAAPANGNAAPAAGKGRPPVPLRLCGANDAIHRAAEKDATEARMEAVEAQITKAMISRLHLYAEKQAEMVGRAGGPVGRYYARELVQDALGDTVTGVLRWDPQRETLESHLMDLIRWRTRDERRRAAVSRTLSLDVLGATGLRAQVEETMVTRPERAEGAADRAVLWMGELRALAASDPDVLAMLDVMTSGTVEKSKIMETLKLTANEYRRTRTRMCRLADRVKSVRPSADKESAHEAR